MCSGCRDDRTDELTIVTEMSRFERQLPSKIEGATAAQGDLARTREQMINIIRQDMRPTAHEVENDGSRCAGGGRVRRNGERT